MIIEFFDSELEEGWKEGYCLICRSEKCKHLVKWKHLIKWKKRNLLLIIKEQFRKFGIGSGNIPIKIGRQPLRYPQGHLSTQLKSKPTSSEEKIQIEERARSRIGNGVQTWSGFVGSYRVK